MKDSLPELMDGMVLDGPGRPLRHARLPRPVPGPGEVLLRVKSCGICRTDLHVADGELADPKLPLILGHEIVGVVVEAGAGVGRLSPGDRVGVPWLGWTCGSCRYCQAGRENLCDRARFTGYHRDGGYAGYALADARFCFVLPAKYDDVHAAPLLCAGLIGHRSLRAAGEAERLGLYGFGAAAHLVAQIAVYQGRKVFVFTRDGDREGQGFARELGATWAGSSSEAPPEALDGAIIFAPVGALVPAALRVMQKGATLVCAGIHMSPIPSFPYDILWGERSIRSVANLTRQDGEEFFRVAATLPLHIAVEPMPLSEANHGLSRLRDGLVRGAVVLVPSGT
jgi:alcohol dehydrogenase, propanol-preferring